MQKIFLLIITFICFVNLKANEIHKSRNVFEKINISFLEQSLPSKSLISELNEKLAELKSIEPKIDNLISAFEEFKSIFTQNTEIDTVKKAFRIVNNSFNSLFGNYFLDELNNSSKKKIIIFSTSMSCECTLEMCYKQEAEIQKLQKENPDLFDYAVVDCFTNFDLQSKYEVGFIPIVLILDSKNKEVKRFTREENLYAELNKYLLENKNGNEF